MKIAVIGAGISGLSCAFELQKAGHDVTVFEKKKNVGGRMSTNEKDGFYADEGVNYFLPRYKQTKKYCEEFGIPFLTIDQSKQRFLYKNQLLGFKLSEMADVFRFPGFSIRNGLKALTVLFWPTLISKSCYDFSINPAELDSPSTDKLINKFWPELNDYYVEGLVNGLLFYRCSELSQTMILSSLKESLTDFGKNKYIKRMQTLPEAFAKRLHVEFKEVKKVTPTNDKVELVFNKSKKSFDKSVIACPQAEKIYKGTAKQNDLLAKLRFSKSVGIVFRAPADLISKFGIIFAGHKANSKIASVFNEGRKGIGPNGEAILSVGLHEDFARKILKKKSKEIFQIIRKELPNVVPFLKTKMDLLKDHYLLKIDIGLPKYTPEYVRFVRGFWKDGQGDNNVYFSGDWMNAPMVEGSIKCGQKVAGIIKNV